MVIAERAAGKTRLALHFDVDILFQQIIFFFCFGFVHENRPHGVLILGL